MEDLLAERKKLFSLELERYREIVDNNRWFNLQGEFKAKGTSLSQSMLIWVGEAGDDWCIADFENKTTYDIQSAENRDGTPMIEVWAPSSALGKLVTSTDENEILSRLFTAQGTDQGFIDLLRRLNLDEFDLDELKRIDLSGAGFSFESVNGNLVVVHKMLREIMTVSREWLLDLSQTAVHNLNSQIRQFYDEVEKIKGFEITDENPRETHYQLLHEISQFCAAAKDPLEHIIAYLSSRRVGQLETNVKITVAEAEDQLKNVRARVDEIGKVAEGNEAARQKKFEDLEIAMQNQLAEKPISQYKAIFQEQANEHHKNARFWLGMAGVATGAFVVTFILLTKYLKIEGTDLAGTLQNLFTKGFLLSPIYVWLNRSIKNHTAQKHLEVINSHRQNALETFDTFVTAAGDNRETRDAVLLAATEAIFDANQTGYLSTKGAGADSKSPIQQIIREIITKPSKRDG